MKHEDTDRWQKMRFKEISITLNVVLPEVYHPVVSCIYSRQNTSYDNICHFLQPSPPQKPLRHSWDNPLQL